MKNLRMFGKLIVLYAFQQKGKKVSVDQDRKMFTEAN